MATTTIAVARVLQLRVPVAWQEAVEVARAASEEADRHGTRLTLAGCAIGVDGSVAVGVDGRDRIGPALTDLQLLAALLEGQQAPPELRQLVEAADDALSSFPSEQDAAVKRPTLAWFTRANPEAEIARLARRAIEAEAGRAAPVPSNPAAAAPPVPARERAVAPLRPPAPAVPPPSAVGKALVPQTGAAAIEKLRANVLQREPPRRVDVSALVGARLPMLLDPRVRANAPRIAFLTASLLGGGLAWALWPRSDEAPVLPSRLLAEVAALAPVVTAEAPAVGRLAPRMATARNPNPAATASVAPGGTLPSVVPASLAAMGVAPAAPIAVGPAAPGAAGLASPGPDPSAPAFRGGAPAGASSVGTSGGGSRGPAASRDAASEMRVYSAADAGVEPPVFRRPQLPVEVSDDESEPGRSWVDVVVDERGEVAQVRLHSRDLSLNDRMIVAAAKAWQFLPARKDGRPVKYVLRLPVTP